MTDDVHSAHTAEIEPVTLYRILQLRVDVFVVEQACAYRELDGRDLEPAAQQLWIEQEERVIATLRILDDPDGRTRIGRVATASSARSAGLAARLMSSAISIAGDRSMVLDAQSRLAGWYSRFGFTPAGPEYLEDGIAHVPMTRP